MPKYPKQLLILPVLLLIQCSWAPLFSQGQDRYADELESFSRLIGGEWHLENTYQVFTWGVGKRSLHAESYAMSEGTPKLVSQGSWFWHPGEKHIKGYFTAIEMSVALFEYTTRFEGNTMINELTAYSEDGQVSNYVETWEFTASDTFQWTLYMETGDKSSKLMEGTYRRKAQ